MTTRIVVAQILGAHGVHGRVKLKSFTADETAVFGYAPLTDESGRREFKLRRTGTGKDHFLAEVDGITGKEAADALRGTRLYIERDRLPAPEDEDEFYHADLIGLDTVTADGQPFGTIKAIYDFGAGDMLEIRHVSEKTVFLPFTKACVPVVEVAAGRVVVEPPANFFAPAGPQPAEGEEMPEGALEEVALETPEDTETADRTAPQP
ncbi:ribosome maturation factor RimM [Rhodocista pekingensis]|uniref:Ribosome maturation factor RimM n=1 Tax=Rhodocista pekingensis TaxID=201185 RepID=A0ABW2KWJ2_9PROT